MTNCDPFISEGKLERIPISDLMYSSNIPHKLLSLPVNSPIVDGEKIHIPPVVVYRRDGINYIVNGQFTIDMVVSITGSRDTAVWCKVYENPLFEREEDLFPNQTVMPEEEDKQ